MAMNGNATHVPSLPSWSRLLVVEVSLLAALLLSHFALFYGYDPIEARSIAIYNVTVLYIPARLCLMLLHFMLGKVAPTSSSASLVLDLSTILFFVTAYVVLYYANPGISWLTEPVGRLFGKDVAAIVKSGVAEMSAEVGFIAYIILILIVIWIVSLPLYGAAWILCYPIRLFRSEKSEVSIIEPSLEEDKAKANAAAASDHAAEPSAEPCAKLRQEDMQEAQGSSTAIADHTQNIRKRKDKSQAAAK